MFSTEDSKCFKVLKVVRCIKGWQSLKICVMRSRTFSNSRFGDFSHTLRFGWVGGGVAELDAW